MYKMKSDINFSLTHEMLENAENELNITVRQSRQSGVARATCPD